MQNIIKAKLTKDLLFYKGDEKKMEEHKFELLKQFNDLYDRDYPYDSAHKYDVAGVQQSFLISTQYVDILQWDFGFKDNDPHYNMAVKIVYIKDLNN